LSFLASGGGPRRRWVRGYGTLSDRRTHRRVESMPYVRRSPQGQIDSLHRLDPGGAEFLADDHADVRAFVGTNHDEQRNFSQLDADFVRVIEDVIDTLIVKNVLNITDLPEQAQAKLFARKSFRERVSKSSLRLFEPTDFGDVI
jgi:hypothetical protein